MVEILTGEFFWGIVAGLLLSFLGGWFQATFAFAKNRKNAERVTRLFCIDTISNVATIIRELDKARDRTKIIHHDFLALLDVEFNIFGRNREHMLNLPESERGEVRRFMNEAAIKKLEVSQYLETFYKESERANQLEAAGSAPQARRILEGAAKQLEGAHAAADKLVRIGEGAALLTGKLSGSK